MREATWPVTGPRQVKRKQVSAKGLIPFMLAAGLRTAVLNGEAGSNGLVLMFLREKEA